MNDVKLGIRGTDNGVGTAGVGFVVVPDKDARERYIADCYRTNTLTINGGIGYGYFNGVPCSPDVLQNIKFPTEDKRGTPVVWVKDDVSNLPIIVAWLRDEGDYYYLGENKFRISRGFDKKNVEVFIDGETTEMHINLIGDKDDPAVFKIKINSENKDSEFNLSCDNKVSISAGNELKLTSYKNVALNVTGHDGTIKGALKYEVDKGFTYEDEYKNKVTIVDGEVKIVSKKIILGEGKEPLVLGDTLVDTLSSLIDAILALTVTTPVGPSSPPINSIQFTAIKSKLKSILSNLSNTD